MIVSRLEEVKQFIKDYDAIYEKALELDVCGFFSKEIQFSGKKLYELSKECGLEFNINERGCYRCPFEIRVVVDGYGLFGLLTWEEVKDLGLADKCPMCGSKV